MYLMIICSHVLRGRWTCLAVFEAGLKFENEGRDGCLAVDGMIGKIIYSGFQRTENGNPMKIL